MKEKIFHDVDEKKLTMKKKDLPKAKKKKKENKITKRTRNVKGENNASGPTRSSERKKKKSPFNRFPSIR